MLTLVGSHVVVENLGLWLEFVYIFLFGGKVVAVKEIFRILNTDKDNTYFVHSNQECFSHIC